MVKYSQIILVIYDFKGIFLSVGNIQQYVHQNSVIYFDKKKETCFYFFYFFFQLHIVL